VRITPAKWDAEYEWLRHEEGVRALQTEPKIRIGKEFNWRAAIKVERPTLVGMALQVMGAAVLGLLAFNVHPIMLLPLTALIGGEVIFISSLDHKGKRSAGDH
jgi:hypothetical protein